MKVLTVHRWSAVLLSLWLLAIPPAIAAGKSLDSHRVASSHPPAVRLAGDPSKPLFTIGISGGFTGVHMAASVYRDGRVLTVRVGLGRSSTPVETHVPLSRGAVQAVLEAAVRSHVFAIPRSLQDAVFGADVPVLSFTIATTLGVRSVHVMGTEGSHPARTRAFFPIWSLLYAIAGYPPQIR